MPHSPNGLTKYMKYSAQKKETLRPKTGPEFPQNDKKWKLFGTNLS